MKKPYSDKISISIILITLLAFGACKKNDSSISNPAPPPVTTVTASVSGIVTDLDHNPISKATVTAGSSSATTDVNGVFALKDILLIKDAGFVSITKPGYFQGSRTFLVNANTVNNVTIQLIPKKVSGNFATSSGGTLNLSGGGAVSFSTGNLINTTTSTVYSGDVSVSTYYLNPADDNFGHYMPGNLLGLNSNNQQKILQSFGMATIEMNNAAGEKLQLATGQTATISLPIPSSLQANAPATIALWYFDDTKGVWKQEGSATKQGNNYVGPVAHFSFWTAGQLGQSVRLDATFKDQNGNPLINNLVTIASNNFGTTNGYTDSAGTVSGIIPAGEILEMKIISSFCGITMDSLNIGPYSTDTNLGNITVRTFSTNSVTISGTVVNCNNTPVTNGYVQVNLVSIRINSPITNGSFSITFSPCLYVAYPDSITAYDLTGGQHSIPQSLNGSAGSQNIGQLVACTTLPPVPGFTYSAGSTNLPVTVTFNNTSTNAASYLWDFGDPASGPLDTSTLQNPSHIYATAGNYTVTLSSTGNGITNSIALPIQIISNSNTADSTYINLTLGGVSYWWIPPVDSLVGARVDSSGMFNMFVQGGTPFYNPAKSISFYIINDNAVPGNYPFSLYTTLNDTAYSSSFAGNVLITNVTEYGMVNGYVRGTSSGQLMLAGSSTTIPFACSYRIRRSQ